MKILRTVFLFLLTIGLGFLGFMVYRLYEYNRFVVEHVNQLDMDQHSIAAQIKEPTVIEKLVMANPWSDLQARFKDAVVQVFSQRGEINIMQPQKPPTQSQAFGSAFFINDRELVTNAHVVNQAVSIWIQIPSLGRQQIDAEIVGLSPQRDLALLRLTDEGYKLVRSQLKTPSFLALGDSDQVHRADEVMTLGYPLGQRGLKSTRGVVSGREHHLIQIDAAINPGNSGGPAININGEVIGINSSGITQAQNVGYIIPINDLKLVLDDLRKTPLLRRPFLGVLYNNSSESLAKYLNNPWPSGPYVVAVFKGSSLEKAGVQKGDMIYQINGYRVDPYGDISWDGDKISIIDYIGRLKLGDKVEVVYYRNGKKNVISFVYEQPEERPIREIYPGYEQLDHEIIGGIIVQPLSLNHLSALVDRAPGLAKYVEMKFQMEPILVITHKFPDSLAHRSHTMRVGALINKINGEKVRTLDDFRTQLYKSLKTGDFTIETTYGEFVHFPFDKVLEGEKRLSQQWMYRISPVIQDLIEKNDKKHGNGIK